MKYLSQGLLLIAVVLLLHACNKPASEFVGKWKLKGRSAYISKGWFEIDNEHKVKGEAHLVDTSMFTRVEITGTGLVAVEDWFKGLNAERQERAKTTLNKAGISNPVYTHKAYSFTISAQPYKGNQKLEEPRTSSNKFYLVTAGNKNYILDGDNVYERE